MQVKKSEVPGNVGREVAREKEWHLTRQMSSQLFVAGVQRANTTFLSFMPVMPTSRLKPRFFHVDIGYNLTHSNAR